MYQHWFVSRQKRQLTTILPALIAFNDICVGRIWSGNHELQLKFEDEIQRRSITDHGELRARATNEGGGGARTLYKQMKDLGLVFAETESKKCRLTLVGEALIKGEVSFVEAMRLQLQRYQYPSATSCRGTGAIDPSFVIHPFQFVFRLLLDDRLQGFLTIEEMAGIVIHFAKTDSEQCLNDVVCKIQDYRKNGTCAGFVADTKSKTYGNIANTLFNYIHLTQFIEKGHKSIILRDNKLESVKLFVEDNPKFIRHPQLEENYIRNFGRGTFSRDLRIFKEEKAFSAKEIEETRMRNEYVLLALKTPIAGITKDVVEYISLNTGIDEKAVEKFLVNNYPNGNINDFFLTYRELANMGTAGARDFEIATCEIFKKIFKFKAKHVGPLGNTPDVFVESLNTGVCGIIDNKAYKKGFSITGNYRRVMQDVYIPEYRKYGNTTASLKFFMYIAPSFGSNIDSQIKDINNKTGIPGVAMPVDVFISLAQSYAEKTFTHADLIELFSKNKELLFSDLNREWFCNGSVSDNDLMVAANNINNTYHGDQLVIEGL